MSLKPKRRRRQTQKQKIRILRQRSLKTKSLPIFRRSGVKLTTPILTLLQCNDWGNN